MQAKQTLLEATASGTLDSAFAQLKKPEGPPDTDVLRLQAKQTLMEATESGTLDAALAKLQKPVVPLDTETLRMQAKQTLLEATASGTLDSAFADLKQSTAASRTGELRKKARDTLLTASACGKLQEALAESKVQKTAAAPEMPPDTEASTKETPLEGCAADKLDASLPEAPPSTSTQEVAEPPAVAQDSSALEQPNVSTTDSRLSMKAEASNSPRLDPELDPIPEIREEEDGSKPAEAVPEVVAEPPADISMSSAAPIAAETIADISICSSIGIDMADLKAQLVDGLAPSINTAVKGAVTDVVQNAFSELKAEMDKRDAQASELSTQMSELSKTVASLQESLGAK